MLPNPFRTFRDHRLSIFQAAAADSLRPAGAAPMPDLQRAAAAVASLDAAGLAVPPGGPSDIRPEAWTCARLGLDLLRAELGGSPADRARLEDALTGSRCDPRWAGTLLSYLGYFGRDGQRRRIPYIPPEAAGPDVIQIADNARIALLSDWGTGRRTATAVLQDLARHQPGIVIHLGDIYYAGTAAECEDNFRRPMDLALDRARRQVPVYTLSGNHDMYSGGEGYYGLIGRLNDGPWRQRASYFCLRSANRRWQFIAMDTGLHAYDPFERHPLTFLEPAEESWVAARIGEFPGQTVLLSHHPLFSASARIGPGGPDGWNPHLLASFRRFAAAGRVAAWFWGHEHTLALHAPFAGLARGRCIGCGAIPMFVADRPYSPLPELRSAPALLPPRLGDDGVTYDHGYAIVSLDPDGPARADYFGVGSRTALLHSEALETGTSAMAAEPLMRSPSG
jgi:hypothetical protein